MPRRISFLYSSRSNPSPRLKRRTLEVVLVATEVLVLVAVSMHIVLTLLAPVAAPPLA